MPRLREVEKAKADSFVLRVYKTLFGDRDPVTDPGTATGTPGNWWTVFALSPNVFKHAVAGFQLYRSPECLVEPKIRELGQARAGYVAGSQFVFSQHCKAARDAGLTQEQVTAIPHWQISDLFSLQERAVLAYTDELVLSHGRVSDAIFAQLKEFLTDEAILEFTYITCMYEMHATISQALRHEYDDVPERIIEIAAPTDAPMDVMNMVDPQPKHD
jgi:alkylhydroperoxidase family enzyme